LRKLCSIHNQTSERTVDRASILLDYGLRCSSARAGVIAAYSTAFGISCVALAFWLKNHGHAAA
jgi:hypothetical protein